VLDLSVGDVISGAGIALGTKITKLLTGTGGEGTYEITTTPNIASAVDISAVGAKGGATFANKVVGVSFDQTTAPVLGTSNGSYTIKPIVYSIQNAFNESDVESQLVSIVGETIEPGAETAFTSYPFLALVPKGRGVAYNDLGFTLKPLQGFYANTYDFYVYEIEIYTLIDNVAVSLESFHVSFDPDARNVAANSLFIVDVLDENSQYLKALFNTETYDAILTDIGINPSKLNIIEKTPLKTTADKSFGINTPATNIVTFYDTGADQVILDYLDSTDTSLNLGFANGSVAIPYLENGSDGLYCNKVSAAYQLSSYEALLASSIASKIHETSTFEDLLISAFNGTMNSDVTQKLHTEIDVILDGNVSIDAKVAMIRYADQLRKDCMFFSDLGLNTSASADVNYRKNTILYSNGIDEGQVDTRNVAFFGQTFLVKDKFTGKKIRVTVPYFLAQKIATNDLQYGIHKNFAGAIRGIVTNYIEGSQNYWPTEAEKESLFETQINYIHKVPKSSYLGSQSTSQTKDSPLSRISVARGIFRMQRIAENISDSFRFEYFNENEYKGLTSALENELSKYVTAGACEYVKVLVSATPYQKSRRILDVKIDVKFTDIIEIIPITFVVNR
jgi:hypothetical protein